MIVVGIDPGQEGAIVLLETGEAPRAWRLPHEPSPAGKGRIVDVAALRDLLPSASRVALVALEAPQSPRAAGRQIGGGAALAVGLGWGRLSALLDLAGYPWQAVPAATWHREIVGRGEGDAKARAAAAIRRLLPALDLVSEGCRRPHAGIIDAAGIALWAEQRAR